MNLTRQQMLVLAVMIFFVVAVFGCALLILMERIVL